MANVYHKDLTGAELHEPKGISGASSGEVYIADGAGSGAWGTLSGLGGVFTLTIQLPDATDLATTFYLGIPVACTLVRIVSVAFNLASTADIEIFNGDTSTVIGTHTTGSGAGVAVAAGQTLNSAFTADTYVRLQITESGGGGKISVTLQFSAS